ncbi:glutamyl-tRNA reductase [Clostridium saccharobutylicum]|uniref:Glutamyl-tRNA reductase n=1 Tax=Clostridium saccharobutylicum DSM 13864 TaxID=1345695 RepID=U5MWX6_CLOSA|nr:glutamyl-tRNA reductase [Clostridium saccharobutylicum]AGX44136.1 glutamyl-tRNA reductase HemA [Clostridium saccharobutylicum DSM 13864]AQR91425.1 glutamyl-tRNA reductase [Clostridium saccharobutylicum]AQS01329.1 glutamyl-tRNA reductase [Clostridium saccharobutylicum]AQS10939.1 glutamyl-tRNA reductase [Clostridium saccharobutylicum]AQS15312.1 glutamyl-tRNA reductase [Clostridium saccharobutylicum]
MIGLIGIKRNTPIEIREKITIQPKKYKIYTEELLKIVKEVVILGTCNRTEIYFNAFLCEEELLKKIFKIFGWNYEYREYIFMTKDQDVCRHLFEVCCGFHSKILGEDQILGQVKNAYEIALEENSVSLELHRLFQEAITCGKKFRNESKLFEIPVSSASIVVNESINNGCKKIMVLGYGEVGQLVIKYLLSHKVDIVYLVVRNEKVKDEIEDNRIKVISFQEKNQYINEVDCIIGCTSAPHPVVKKEDINEYGHKLLIYDLAVPRDIEKAVSSLGRTEVYNIDTISSINDDNKKLRTKKMEDNKYILVKYLNEYSEWLKLRSISSKIQNLKELGDSVYEMRAQTFENKAKCKEDVHIANKLIKSTSDFYINRAIKIMKEETLKGCGEDCIKIIEKIFKM